MRFSNAESIRAAKGCARPGPRPARTYGVKHDLVERWTVDGTIVAARVTYSGRDDSQIAVLMVTVYRERDGEINDYRICIDLAPLFGGQTSA